MSELPEQLQQVLQEHRKELLDRLDSWFRSFEASRRYLQPQKAGTLDSFKETWESPDVSHLISTPGGPVDSEAGTSTPQRAGTMEVPELQRMSSLAPPQELSEYQLAQQAHSRVVADFQLQMQSVSEMMESVTSTDFARFRKKTRAIVDSSWFGALFATMVISNSILIGVSLEAQSIHRDNFTGQDLLLGFNIFYAAVFSIEAGMRLFVQGPLGYVWQHSDWAWNWLDMFVVISSWMELIVDLLSKGSTVGGTNTNLRVFRLLRVGRLVRVVRVVRVVKFFRSLRTLVQSLVGTLKALVWSMVLLCMIIYIFAILFTDTVLGYLKENPPQYDERLDLFFGSLTQSVATLFRSISNGMNWGDGADALASMDGGLSWVLVLYFYIAFCSFAVLNVMTGVFCNSAIKAAERDHEMQVWALMQTRRELREQVEFLFHKIDRYGRGKITIQDFEKNFDDEAVVAFFESMEISAMDAWTLFLTLDVDGDHTVGVDEFVERCLQLHGPARSTDLFALRQQTDKIVKQTHELMERQKHIDRQLVQLSRAMTPPPEEPRWI